MTERSRQAQQVAAAQPIRIPRIAIAAPSSQLTGASYLSPHYQHASTIPRSNDILTSPTYIADHLPSRRLSEIDSPFYLPNLLSSTERAERAERTPRSPAPFTGYSTTPLRIRTDVRAQPKYLDTVTDYGTREYHREIVTTTTAPPHADYIRVSEYPATSAVIGLQPPRLMTPTLSPEVEGSKNGDVAETTEDVDRLALYNNASLGYQRICYLLSRYPAVAMTLIATWMLWGRGLGLKSVTSNENVCYIVSFVGGVFIMSSQVILTMNHGNSYKREKILSNLYHFSNTIGTLISITVIVFASISYNSLKNLNATNDTCTWSLRELKSTPGYYCFTPNERIIFLSILIGASSLVIIFYFFSGVYGCIGQSLMKKKRQTEYSQYAAAHDNAAFRF